MSVGAVGGVSAGGGGAAAAAAGGVGGGSSVASAGAAGSVGSVGGDAGTPSTSEAEKSGTGVNVSQNTNITNINMSTQDHMCLRSMAHGHGSSEASGCQEGSLDLKKLIEMMIAIKLLEEMSKNSQGGGFSGMA